MNYKILWVSIIAATPLIFGGCGAFNYKGVSVYVTQDTNVDARDGSTAKGGSYADPESVPAHDQGSDTALPLLKELGDIYGDQLNLFNKCLKLGLSANCKLIPKPPVTLPNPIPPVILPPEIPSEPAEELSVTEAWGSGHLWKPVADSRGGVPAVLTRNGVPQGKLTLHRSDGSIIPATIQYRGLTNGDRETYFILDHKAKDLPKNIVVKIDNRTWLVPDPSQRYD